MWDNHLEGFKNTLLVLQIDITEHFHFGVTLLNKTVNIL